MVTAVVNPARSGVVNWLVQRVGALILLAWLGFIGVILVTSQELDFQRWTAVFEPVWMRIFSVAALLSLAFHTWVGLWCTLTDYVTPRLLGARANLLRGVLMLVCIALLVSYVVWGVQVIWSP